MTTVNLLLLSLGFGAVPGFLSEATGKALSELQIGYLDDARIPYAGQPGVRAERDRLTAAGYAVVDLSAVRQNLEEFATTLDRVDAVYVAGGNTFALLWALRRAGAGDLLAERVRASLPYIGCSAGAVVVGPTIAPVEGLDDPAEAPVRSIRASGTHRHGGAPACRRPVPGVSRRRDRVGAPQVRVAPPRDPARRPPGALGAWRAADRCGIGLLMRGLL